MTTGTYDPYGVLLKINAVADQLGVPESLADSIAQQESGLNPYAVGDNGTSFGLYQLHEGGELPASWQAGPWVNGPSGRIPQQAADPTQNALVSLSVVANVQRAHPNWTPGQIAAGAQRPADQAAYARSINDKVGAVSTYGALSQNGATSAVQGQSVSIGGDVEKGVGNAIGGVVGTAGKAFEQYVIMEGPFIRLAEFIIGTLCITWSAALIAFLLAKSTNTGQAAPGIARKGAKAAGKAAEVAGVIAAAVPK